MEKRAAMLVAAAAVALAGAAATAAAPTASTFVVVLKPKNSSGVTGTAAFTLVGRPNGVEKWRVVLTVRNAGAGVLPAHVHTGTCAMREPTLTNPRLFHELEYATRGRSVTTIYSLKPLRKQTLSVNVHAAKRPHREIACGNLPRA